LNESRKTLGEISVFESMLTDLNLTFGFDSTVFITKIMFNYLFQILNEQTANWFNGLVHIPDIKDNHELPNVQIQLLG
jgi:hypothetical protein